MADFEKEVEQWLNVALINEKLQNLKVTECKGSENVDGFSGSMKFVKATADKNGKTQEYNLVVKYSYKDDPRRKTGSISLAFKREIYIYDYILKSFRSFEDAHGVQDHFEAYPKFYKGLIFDDMEVIVFDNLKIVGFQINKNPAMNWEERALIAREYAKFHAISFAMRQKDPERFRKLTQNLNNLMGMFMKLEVGMQKIFCKQYEDSLKILQKHNEQKLFEYFKKYSIEDVIQFACQNYEDEERYSVVVHADNWNNNFMLKYKNDGNLDKCVIIDYQISTLSTPLRDISNFFYFNTDPELFDSEVHKFFDYYYQELEKNLKNYECDINIVFPKSILLEHWKKYSKLAFVLSQMCIQMRYANKADIKAEGDFEDMLDNFTIKDNDAVERSIICLFRHFYDNSLV